MTNRRTEKALRKYEDYEQHFLATYKDNPKGVTAVLIEQNINTKSNSFLVAAIITIVVNLTIQGFGFFIANTLFDYLPPESVISITQTFLIVYIIVSLFSIFVITCFYCRQKIRIKDVETKKEIIRMNGLIEHD